MGRMARCLKHGRPLCMQRCAVSSLVNVRSCARVTQCGSTSNADSPRQPCLTMPSPMGTPQQHIHSQPRQTRDIHRDAHCWQRMKSPQWQEGHPELPLVFPNTSPCCLAGMGPLFPCHDPFSPCHGLFFPAMTRLPAGDDTQVRGGGGGRLRDQLQLPTRPARTQGGAPCSVVTLCHRCTIP